MYHNTLTNGIFVPRNLRKTIIPRPIDTRLEADSHRIVLDAGIALAFGPGGRGTLTRRGTRRGRRRIHRVSQRLQQHASRDGSAPLVARARRRCQTECRPAGRKGTPRFRFRH